MYFKQDELYRYVLVARQAPDGFPSSSLFPSPPARPIPPGRGPGLPYVIRTAFASIQLEHWNNWNTCSRTEQPTHSPCTRIVSAPTSQVVRAKSQPSCVAASLLAAVYLWSLSVSLVGVPRPVHSCQVQILLCADTTRTRTPASSEMSLRQALLSSLA